MSRRAVGRRWAVVVGAVVLLAGQGCQTLGNRPASPSKDEYGPTEVVADFKLPKELNKVSLPEYVVEAPDVLLIDALRLIPLPPYRVEPLDVLYLFAPGAPDQNPINGLYPVDPDGTINLGPTYGGVVKVADLTVLEIEGVVARKLKGFLREPATTVTLAQTRGVQQIRGEHLVRPDGTVGLGSYGAVYVAGMTLRQVKAAVEQHLAKYLYRPEVNVDVYGYNSKYYYVITDFVTGENVVRLPSTGNETVLDAIAQIGGLSSVSSKRVWVARPAPAGCGDQILPVDWKGITRRGHTATNYQILPGDRVFVMAQPGAKINSVISRTLAPVEQVLGVTLLGVGVGRALNGNGLFGNNSNGTGNQTVIVQPATK